MTYDEMKNAVQTQDGNQAAALQYAQGVLAGKIEAGDSRKWECKRFLDGLRNGVFA